MVKVNARLLLEPRDLWIGLYWKFHKSPGGAFRTWTFYICLVPMLPIKVQVRHITPIEFWRGNK